MPRPSLEDAIALALRVHRGQVDKAGQPYILHPLRVMLGLETEEERIVGVLHDVVEDSGKDDPAKAVALDDLRRQGYSEEVVAALDSVTRSEGESYEEFILRLKPNPLARRVKLADLKDNLDVRRLGSVGERDLERLNRYLNAWRQLVSEG